MKIYLQPMEIHFSTQLQLNQMNWILMGILKNKVNMFIVLSTSRH